MGGHVAGEKVLVAEDWIVVTGHDAQPWHVLRLVGTWATAVLLVVGCVLFALAVGGGGSAFIAGLISVSAAWPCALACLGWRSRRDESEADRFAVTTVGVEAVLAWLRAMPFEAASGPRLLRPLSTVISTHPDREARIRAVLDMASRSARPGLDTLGRSSPSACTLRLAGPSPQRVQRADRDALGEPVGKPGAMTSDIASVEPRRQ